MKRIISAVLLFVIAISLAGCRTESYDYKEKPTVLEIGKTHKIEDFAEFTLVKITTSKRLWHLWARVIMRIIMMVKLMLMRCLMW